MKTVPSDSRSPPTLNWLNWSKYRQETQLLPMVLLKWLSSCFLISKRNIQVHQKDTLDLSIHSSCWKGQNDGGCLRLNPVLSREFKVKSPPWLERQTWPVHWLSQSRTNRRYHAFVAPSPPKDWHGDPFPTHGELAQGLSLTLRPSRTASPLCFFSRQWPETWLSPAFCVNILAHFEVCFQKFG